MSPRPYMQRLKRASAGVFSTGRAFSQRGMTLIELIVTLAVIAILITVSAVAISSIRSADVDATASKLAGAMTYVSALAVHENRTYRLVLDMDERKFWAEAINSEDPCARYQPEDMNQGLQAADAEGDPEGMVQSDYAKSVLDLLRDTNFEPGTNVTAVLTSQHTSPQLDGKAALYFYPSGYAERALVWVGERADDGNGWVAELTVELHTLGRITRHNEPVDERKFDLSREEDLK